MEVCRGTGNLTHGVQGVRQKSAWSRGQVARGPCKPTGLALPSRGVRSTEKPAGEWLGTGRRSDVLPEPDGGGSDHSASPPREGRLPWGPHTPSTLTGSVPACGHGATDSDADVASSRGPGRDVLSQSGPARPPPTLTLPRAPPSSAGAWLPSGPAGAPGSLSPEDRPEDSGSGFRQRGPPPTCRCLSV